MKKMAEILVGSYTRYKTSGEEVTEISDIVEVTKRKIQREIEEVGECKISHRLLLFSLMKRYYKTQSLYSSIKPFLVFGTLGSMVDSSLHELTTDEIAERVLKELRRSKDRRCLVLAIGYLGKIDMVYYRKFAEHLEEFEKRRVLC